ncbi:MAG: hypothetical protein R6T78_01265 [Dehalococcoidales bacterium]
MNNEQWILLAINIAGGAAVLGSYFREIKRHPGKRNDIWGGVPERIKPLYTVSMLLAAVGYLAFSYFIVIRADPDEIEIGNNLGFGVFYPVYILILLPSAMWMPFTYKMLQQPSKATWIQIRLILALVGIASLALLALISMLEPREPGAAYWAAVTGAAFFCIQTAVLDALIWPAFFKVNRKGVSHRY